jgi:NTP pyrophosphatase (non-canonical NTP hydrolase)
MDNIFEEIRKERQKQDDKWGEQNHKPIEWVAILTEEVGEVSKAALEAHFKQHFWDIEKLSEYRKELLQTAAVAVAMVESLDRNRLRQ